VFSFCSALGFVRPRDLQKLGFAKPPRDPQTRCTVSKPFVPQRGHQFCFERAIPSRLKRPFEFGYIARATPYQRAVHVSARTLDTTSLLPSEPNDSGKVFILSFYKLAHVAFPEIEITRHRAYLEQAGVFGRVYVAKTGINAQCSGPKAVLDSYMDFVKTTMFTPSDNALTYTMTPHTEPSHPYPRLNVKKKANLVGSFGDVEIDISKTGTHLSPAQWRSLLESSDEDYVLVDVRNKYEWEVGHFKAKKADALRLPPLDSFRQFPEYTENLKDKVDPKNTKVIMCCTGGIRCEILSAYMKDRGFEHVYQLQGGILNYAKEEGDASWTGKLFVFDERMTVALGNMDDDQPAAENLPETAKCIHCSSKVDKHVTCANVDCNRLFLCCNECMNKNNRCCSIVCSEGERVRPYVDDKPFSRLHNYQPWGLIRKRQNKQQGKESPDR